VLHYCLLFLDALDFLPYEAYLYCALLNSFSLQRHIWQRACGASAAQLLNYIVPDSKKRKKNAYLVNFIVPDNK